MVLNSAHNGNGPSSWAATSKTTSSCKTLRLIRPSSGCSRKRRPNVFAATTFFVTMCAGGLTSEFSVAAAEEEDSVDEPSLTFDRPDSPVALLVALQDGPAGEDALREWSSYMDGVFEAGVPGDQIPSVWIMTSDEEAVALAEELPHVGPLSFASQQSWEETLGEFVYQNGAATTFGLLGEGALPHPELVEATISLEAALARSAAPTVVLTRSRSTNKNLDGDGGGGGGGVAEEQGTDDGGSRGGGGGGVWLSDAFTSQVWINADMLVSDRLRGAGLDVHVVQGLSLLRVLPYLVEGALRDGAAVVDGTSVVGSIFSVGEGGEQDLPAPEAGGFGIGTLKLALVGGRDGGGGGGDVEVGKAPWPPLYVLETVANEDGVVMVNSVNCGYLDFASNFLQSVRRFSDIKVLWVTTDEVAFDFLDALVPGCVAMFPGDNSERKHATGAGTYGDSVFQSQVLLRPRLLQSILAAGYTALWTDSDIVWLGNPLLLLPSVHDPSSSEMMLQNDGAADNKCTCFLYLRPTDTVKELLVLWEQSIVDDNASEDQKPFRAAFMQQQDAGLRYAIVPPEMFPTGLEFFDHDYVEDYAQVYHSQALIAHNNWIKGHSAKLQRFRKYHLWDVEETSFPLCSERR